VNFEKDSDSFQIYRIKRTVETLLRLFQTLLWLFEIKKPETENHHMCYKIIPEWHLFRIIGNRAL